MDGLRKGLLPRAGRRRRHYSNGLRGTTLLPYLEKVVEAGALPRCGRNRYSPGHFPVVPCCSLRRTTLAPRAYNGDSQSKTLQRQDRTRDLEGLRDVEAMTARVHKWKAANQRPAAGRQRVEVEGASTRAAMGIAFGDTVLKVRLQVRSCTHAPHAYAARYKHARTLMH